MAEMVARDLERVAAEVRQYGLAAMPTISRTAEAAHGDETYYGKSRYQFDLTIERGNMAESEERRRRFAESPLGRAMRTAADDFRDIR